MKTRIMIKNVSYGLAFMLLMLISATGYSQVCAGSKVAVRHAIAGTGNETISNVVYSYVDVDIFLTNTGTTSLKLAMFNGSLTYPAPTLAASGILTSVVTQPAATGNFPGFVAVSTQYIVSTRQIRIIETPLPALDPSLKKLVQGQEYWFCRVRMSVPGLTVATPSSFSLPTAITGGYQIQTSTTYCSLDVTEPIDSPPYANTSFGQTFAAGTLTISTPQAFTLPPGSVCATAAVASNLGAVTCFGGNNGTATITLNASVTDTAYSYTVDGNAGGSGTLVGNAFTISNLTAGSHTIVVTNGSCASTLSVPVTISGPSAALTNETTVSACDSYFWSVTGQTYTEGGDKTGTTTNVDGCTVNETLHLTVTPSTTSGSVTTSICSGETYVWPANGQSYTTEQSGVTFVSGCNTATLNLSINPLTTTGSESVTACGSSYVWPLNGQTYNESGVYPYTVGCNTATLTLTLNPATTTGSESVSACGSSYTWAVNGQTYNESGVYPYTVGCNTATLTLTLTPSTTSGSVTTSICSGQTYVWPANGQSYTTEQSGVTFVSGCNTATLNLTINPLTTTGSESVTACGTSYTWSVNGQTYNASGVYPYTVGCNTATLTLTLNTAAQTYYADTDGDGFGAGEPILSCTGQPANTVTNDTDCAPADPTKWTSANLYVDADNDGFYNGNNTPTPVCYGASVPAGFTTEILGTDCNDNLAAINPNASEVLANGVDENCDGNTDESYQPSYVIPAQCGTTLSYVGSVVYAYSVPQANGYRFEVTGGSQGTRVYDSATNNFRLTSLPGGVTYATTYAIRVSPRINGFYRAYNTSCNITTPTNPLTTNVVTSQCGTTVASMSTSIYADQVTAASQYRFEVTGSTQGTRTYTTAFNRFSFSNLAGSSTYGATYSVRVALFIGGVWQDYGTACNVTTPANLAVTSLTGASCGLVIPTNSWTSIYAAPVADAQGYRFEVTTTSPSTLRYVDRPTANFNLHQLSGGYLPSTVYTVRVAVLYNGIYQAFGPSCTVTTGAGINKAAVADTAVFAVKAYPNPYADTFKLAMDSSSQERVEVKVYDMIGKLVETRQVNASELATQEVGARYPSGVYNIIVTQGENVKTLRVIKR